ncbi:MAG: hypothetical protein ACP5N7_04350 [Candidatus Pacearchaeota archaeon]
MGKKLLLGLTFSIFLITFTSAGWFSDLFNKPDLSPVDVGVQLDNSPPTIKRFFSPGSLGQEYTQPFTANPGAGFGVFYVGIVVEDANGPSDLPQGTGLAPASSAYFEIAAPVNSINPSITRPVVLCDSYLCDNPTLGSNCDNPSRQLMYVCAGAFLPSDPASSYSGASPNGNDLWRIRVATIDLAANPSDMVTSGDAGFNSVPGDYVQINELSAYNLATTALNWNSLNINTPNQVASAPLIVENYGNVPLTTIEITGTDLTGTNPVNPSAILSVDAFSASGSSGQASCDTQSTAAVLRHQTPVGIPGVSIPYTASGPGTDRDEIYVCAFEQLSNAISGPSSISYGGTWDVVAS